MSEGMQMLGRAAITLAFISYCSFSIFPGNGRVFLGEVLMHRPLSGGMLLPQLLGWIGWALAYLQLFVQSRRRWSVVALWSLLLLLCSLTGLFLRTEGSNRSLIAALPFLAFGLVGAAPAAAILVRQDSVIR